MIVGDFEMSDNFIKLKISFVVCKYCSFKTYLVNDYGGCPKGCPGNFKTIDEQYVNVLKSELKGN